MNPSKKSLVALVAAAFLLQSLIAPVAFAGMGTFSNKVTAQPDVSPKEALYFINPNKEPKLSRAKLVKLLRKRIKYVFIIFNENHSFDNEYGTFPGVNGIYSDGRKARSAADTPGFTQTYTDNVTGATVTVHPFRLGPNENSTVMDSVDHSNTGMIAKYDVTDGVAKMDGYAKREYQRHAGTSGTTPTAAEEEEGTQFARLVMSHVDCDTIPFFWQYASRFTIFDNIFATEDGPSTPNAIAMISGQVGQTQWVKHPNPDSAVAVGTHSGNLQEPPVINDPQPFWGSQFDTTSGDISGTPPYIRQPDSPSDYYGDANIMANLTFASLPLTFQGKDITDILSQDPNYSADTADIQKDIPYHLR